MNLMDANRASPKGEPKMKAPRNRMRQVSRKRADYRKSDVGQSGMAYMGLAATLPCVQCGATWRKRDLHHCKDKPPYGEDGPYEKSPHKHNRTGDMDVIPLCQIECHNGGPNSYHVAPKAWAERNGPDYGFILSTRAAVAALAGEIDF